MKNFYLKYLTILGIVLLLELVVFTTLIVTKTIDEKSYSFTHLLGVILLFISGFTLSNHYQKRGFLIGLLQALVVITIFMLINILGLNNQVDTKLLIKMLLYLLSGALGGVMGVNIKNFI